MQYKFTNKEIEQRAFLKTIINEEFKTEIGEIFNPYDYQLDVCVPIVFKKYNRILINMTTQAGKSDIISLASLLLTRFYPGEKILMIAPQGEQSTIIKNYSDKHLLESKLMKSNIAIYENETDKISKKLRRLTEQTSKYRVTFSNNSEIKIASANINQKGKSLQGHAGTTIFIDECERIPKEIIRSMIYRMILKRPDVSIICISNPIERGFMYDHINTENWHYIQVGWKRVVKESRGRITKEMIMELKKEMTPVEFTIWCESKYPDKVPGQLISNKYIEWAYNNFDKKIRERSDYSIDINGKEYDYDHFMYGFDWKIKPHPKSIFCLGTDPAGEGKDQTVHILLEKRPDGIKILRDIDVIDKDEPVKTAGRILQKVVKWGKAGFIIKYLNVDDGGLGFGTTSILNEKLYQYGNKDIIVRPIKFGGKPFKFSDLENEINNKQYEQKIKIERFQNEKSRLYINLQKEFESSKIYIPKSEKLIKQLQSINYEISSEAKIKIKDNKDKGESPDWADALAIANDIPEFETYIGGIEL